jgi:hypothetical protein
MKKIKEAQGTLQDVEYLINQMDRQIKLLRNIVYRYGLLHGEEIQGGKVDVPDSIEFYIQKENDVVICKAVDYKDIGMKSKQEDINKLINNLNEEA